MLSYDIVVVTADVPAYLDEQRERGWAVVHDRFSPGATWPGWTHSSVRPGSAGREAAIDDLGDG